MKNYLLKALLFGTVFCSIELHAREFYISSTGSDINAGGSNAPWQTINKINQTALSGGDGVHFQGGQTFTGTLVIRNSGVKTNPIRIDSYGNGTATILAASNQDGIRGTNVGGVWIRNLLLTNTDTNSTNGCGINFLANDPNGAHYPGILIQDVEVSGFADVGINIGGWTNRNAGWDFLWASRVHAHDNGEGMKTYGFTMAGFKPSQYVLGSISVLDSEFDHNWSSGLELCGAGQGVVDRCSFHENLSTGGCWTWGTHGIVIQNCVSWANLRGDATDGFGFDLDGGSQDCTIQYCLSFENDTPGFTIFDYPQSAETKGNTIRYCISENDVRLDGEWGSFEISPYADTPVSACNIYNCVAYLTTRSGTNEASGFESYGKDPSIGYGWYAGGVVGCSFRNNIIYLDGPASELRLFTGHTGSLKSTQVIQQGNLYYSVSGSTSIYYGNKHYSSFSDWLKDNPGQEHVGKSSVGLLTNPLLDSVGTAHLNPDPYSIARISSYRPAYWSPCLGHGLNLKRLFKLDPGAHDFWGNPLSLFGAYNIGAF